MPFKKQRIQLFAALANMSPVFDPKNPQPLAVGIADEVAKQFPDAPPKLIDKSLRWWTDRSGYHQAVIEGGWRHDIEGNRVAAIEPSHQKWSQGRLVYHGRQKTKKAKRNAARCPSA